MDELVEFVLDEIAMDGPQGSSIRSVFGLIRTGLCSQSLDSEVEGFILDKLINHHQISVGKLDKQTNKLERDPSFSVDQVEFGSACESGDDWFVWVDGDISWEAITGSHQRPSSVTPAVYAILCSVSRSRASGKSVAELGKELGIDQRSMFHYIKTATNIGAVKKFRTTDQGSWTNHIVHVRYLNQSKKWQAHIAADGEPEPLPTGHTDNHNQDDDPDNTGHEMGGLSVLLSSTHLHSNPSLIRRRILTALAAADHHTLPHSQVANRIGLLYFTTKDQRKFNGILREMVGQGSIERVMIQGHLPGHRSSGLRLLDNSSSPVTEAEAQAEAQAEVSQAQFLVTLERQVVELLAGADEEGLIGYQVGLALGEYSSRATDQTLVRLSREVVPPGLDDLGVKSMTETVGREKRTRWFTKVGHTRRCARDGLVLPQPSGTTTGLWSEPTLSVGQYQSVQQFDKLLAHFNANSQLPSAPAWNATPSTRPTRGTSSTPAFETNKTIGRPRKHPLPPGKLTYYERRKRQLAEQALASTTESTSPPPPSPLPTKPLKPKRLAKAKVPAGTPPSTLASSPAPIPPLAPSPAAGPEQGSEPEPVVLAAGEGLSGDGAAVKAEPKVTLTLLSRQRDLLSLIQSRGGIIENAYRLNEALRAYLSETRPTEKVHTMDRQVLNKVAHSLVDSKQCRLTVVTTAQSARVEVISLSTIDPQGSQMTSWLSDLNTRPRLVRGYQPSTGARALVPASTEPAPLTAPVPSGDDGLDKVADYFRQADKAVGYWRGARPGRFARARILHRHLLRLAQAKGTPDRLVSHVDVIQQMPIGEWLSVIMVNDDDPVLDQFLADETNRSLRLDQVPDRIAHLVRNRRRRQALVQLLGSLAQLGVISSDCAQTKLSQTSSWKINSSGPIYSLNQSTRRLITVVRLETEQDADSYWDLIHANSMPASVGSFEVQHSEFPAEFGGQSSLVTALTTKSKWQTEAHLTADQRKYLTRLARHDPSRVVDSELAAQLAQAILASPSQITTYFTRQLNRFAKGDQVPKRLKQHKRGRKTRSFSIVSPIVADDQAKTGGVVSLRRKAMDATAQRQRDFNSILSRFNQDHAQPVLHKPALDYLARAFTGAGRGTRGEILDANHLERELMSLLPNSVPNVSTFESIVPKSILSKASSSYSLPKILTLPPRPPRKDKGVRRPTTPTISSGTQLDFLSTAPRLLPPQAAGTRIRLSRHYFSEEQEELILDAGAVIKARAKLNNQRAQFGPLQSLFPGFGTSKLRQILLRLIAKPDHDLYHSRLVQAWIEACQSPTVVQVIGSSVGASLTQFDLAAHVRALRSAINKHSLRLAGAPPATELNSVELSSSIRELTADYTIDCVNPAGDRFGDYWRPSPSHATREVEVANLAFSLAQVSLDSPRDREISSAELSGWRARGALKMILVTPEGSYDQALAHALLRPFVDQLESIVHEMLQANLMVKVVPDPTRRTPGRNFVLTDKFLGALDSYFTSVSALNEVQVETEFEWPIVCEQGAAISLIDQVSLGTCSIKVEPELSTQARDRDDYQTRKADDEVIESAVLYQPNSVMRSSNVELDPPPIWPGLVTTDHSTQTRLKARHADYSAALVSALEEAGPTGLSVEQVCIVGTPDEVSLVTGQTLAFWAGILHPRLVGYQFVEWWTVEVSVSPSTSDSNRRLALPAVWVGLNGMVIQSIWLKVVGLIATSLLRWPGANWHELLVRAVGSSSERVLSLTEVIAVLEALERSGRVHRSDSAPSLAQAGWFLNPGWNW